MDTVLLAVGKLRPAFRGLCDEYLSRCRRYAPLAEREIRESGHRTSLEVRRREESSRLLEAVPARARLVALDRRGAAWASEDLAKHLERWLHEARGCCLVLGGDAGLDPALVSRAEFRWSLGPLTLPHQLARVVVAEQWYRAWTIIRGEPYHRGE